MRSGILSEPIFLHSAMLLASELELHPTGVQVHFSSNMATCFLPLCASADVGASFFMILLIIYRSTPQTNMRLKLCAQRKQQPAGHSMERIQASHPPSRINDAERVGIMNESCMPPPDSSLEAVKQRDMRQRTRNDDELELEIFFVIADPSSLKLTFGGHLCAVE